MAKFWLYFISFFAVTYARSTKSLGIGYRSFPYVVRIQLLENGTTICGGTLISPSHVITAAQCFLPKHPVVVVAGFSDPSGKSYQMRHVKSIDIGDNILEDIADKNIDDIAILSLSKPFKPGENIKIAYYSPQNLQPTTRVTMIGMNGFRGRTTYASQLLAEVGAVSKFDGRRENPLVDSSKLIYIEPVKRGEMPLHRNSSGCPATYRDHIIGILIQEDGEGKDGVLYTNVSYYHKWIEKFLRPERDLKTLRTNRNATRNVWKFLTKAHASNAQKKPPKKTSNPLTATYGQYPYVVSLQLEVLQRNLCTGILLAESHVLTAEHCFRHDLNRLGLVFVGGTTHIHFYRETHQRVKVKSVITYPKRNRADDVFDYDDIAIAVLLGTFFQTDLVRFLPYKSLDAPLGTEVYVLGWSENKTNIDMFAVVPADLRYSRAQISNYEKCGYNELVEMDQTKVYCITGYGPLPKFASKGDIGGPAIYNGSVVGMVSRARLGGDYGVLYTKISFYNNWIDKILNTVGSRKLRSAGNMWRRGVVVCFPLIVHIFALWEI